MKNAVDYLYSQLSKANAKKAYRFCSKLPALINYIEVKLGIIHAKPIEFPRIAFLFSGYSEKFSQEVVVKIFPDYLSTYMYESAGYSALSSSYMCPVLGFFDDLKVIVMKKLYPLKHNRDSVFRLFESVAADSPITPCYSPMYYDIWQKTAEEAYILNQETYSDDRFTVGKALSDSIWVNNFSNANNWLCHGDLHQGNLMESDGNVYAIDPLAYVAPYPFRFTRAIIVPALYDGASLESMLMRINTIADICKGLCSKDDICLATVIDANFLRDAYCVQFPMLDKLHVFNSVCEATTITAQPYI